MTRKPSVFSCWTTVVLLLTFSSDLRSEDFTIELSLEGQRIEGMPLAWSNTGVTLLARDGHVWNFVPSKAQGFRRTSARFESYSQGDIRAQLKREFGSDFEVSGTGHYLVVHPAGKRNMWAPRFEKLHRSFLHYFTARGWRPKALQFPLIAVVFPQQQDYLHYAADTGDRLMPGTLGYYSPTTNRIALYDITAGQGSDENWHINAETIIHEATHQTAFNTGIHSRFSTPPQWVIEGLATVFEAPGVWNPRQFTRRQDRLNRGRLTSFQQYAATRRQKGSLVQFISSDRKFASDPDGAYAEAWALTYFLAETMPQKYLAYLQKTASRPNFTSYSTQDRYRDFTEVFGENFPVLESHFLRFIARQK